MIDFQVVDEEEARALLDEKEPSNEGVTCAIFDEEDYTTAAFYGDDGKAYARLFVYFAQNGAVDLAIALNDVHNVLMDLRQTVRAHVESGHDQNGELQLALDRCKVEVDLG